MITERELRPGIHSALTAAVIMEADMSEEPQGPTVDLGKSSSGSSSGESSSTGAGHGNEGAFDPYRFGKPDHPVPPEYAPPGYAPETPPSPYGSAGNAPYGQTGTPYPPPSPWGAPGYGPPPGHYATAQPRGNGKAVAALVLGIVSIVMFWLSFFNGLFIVLALVFGILGLTEAGSRGGAGKGMAIAGLICMGVGTVATVLYTVWLLHIANQCGGLDNGGDPGFSQCVRDHF